MKWLTKGGKPSQKTFFKLAVPNVITNLTVPLAGLIDMALLGHLPDKTPLAGVALAGLIFDYSYWSFGFLRMGTTGLTAKAFGARDNAESAAIFLRGMILAMCCGLLLLSFQKPLAEFSFWLLSGGDAVENQGRAYFYARIWGAPAALGGYALIGWFLGRQRPAAALIHSVTLYGLNIALDWYFIMVKGWGTRGAGLATMISEYAALVVGLFLASRLWGDHPRLSFAMLKNKEKLTALFKLNGNIMIRTFCLITSFGLFTNVSAQFGAVVLAANALLMKLLGSAAYFIDGFAFALESLVGRYDGEGDKVSVKNALRTALFWNLVCVGFAVLVFMVAGRDILELLTIHDEIINQALAWVPLLCLTLLFSGFAYIYDGYFIGLSAGPVLRNGMLVSLLVGMLPGVLVAQIRQEPVWLWSAMIGFMIMRTLTLGKAAHFPKKVQPK